MSASIRAFIMTAAVCSLVSSGMLLGGCTAQKKKTLVALQVMQIAQPPQTVSVRMTGYTPATGRTFSNLFVRNFSVKASQGQLSLVSSRDGLPDSLKQLHTADYGFSTLGPNTANPNFSDILLYLSGITTPSQSLLYCASNQANSSSNDALIYNDSRTAPATQQFLGLRDCEKLYIGLNPNLFDFDGDGIPDYLELHCGLNPKNPNDANLSVSGDGVTNLEKCKRGIAVDESANSQPNQLFAYKYLNEIQNDGSRNITVSNIPILNGGQDNFLAFYLTETDNTTQTSYLYTAYSILKSGAGGKTFVFQFWGSAGNPNQNFNQEISFQ